MYIANLANYGTTQNAGPFYYAPPRMKYLLLHMNLSS